MMNHYDVDISITHSLISNNSMLIMSLTTSLTHHFHGLMSNLRSSSGLNYLTMSLASLVSSTTFDSMNRKTLSNHSLIDSLTTVLISLTMLTHNTFAIVFLIHYLITLPNDFAFSAMRVRLRFHHSRLCHTSSMNWQSLKSFTTVHQHDHHRLHHHRLLLHLLIRHDRHLLHYTVSGIHTQRITQLISVVTQVVRHLLRRCHSHLVHHHLWRITLLDLHHQQQRQSPVMHAVRRVTMLTIHHVRRRLRRLHLHLLFRHAFLLIEVLLHLLHLLHPRCNFEHHLNELHLLLIFFHRLLRSQSSPSIHHQMIHRLSYHQSDISPLLIDVSHPRFSPSILHHRCHRLLLWQSSSPLLSTLV